MLYFELTYHDLCMFAFLMCNVSPFEQNAFVRKFDTILIPYISTIPQPKCIQSFLVCVCVYHLYLKKAMGTC